MSARVRPSHSYSTCKCGTPFGRKIKRINFFWLLLLLLPLLLKWYLLLDTKVGSKHLRKMLKYFVIKTAGSSKGCLTPHPTPPLYLPLRQLRTDNYLSRARGLSRRRNCCVKCFICCDEFSWHCWLIWPAFVVPSLLPTSLAALCLSAPFSGHKGCTEIKSKEYAAPLLQSALCDALIVVALARGRCCCCSCCCCAWFLYHSRSILCAL